MGKSYNVGKVYIVYQDISDHQYSVIIQKIFFSEEKAQKYTQLLQSDNKYGQYFYDEEEVE